MKALTFLFAVVSAFAVSATSMDAKAKVIRTIPSVLSGPVEITCDDVGTWSFDVQAGLDAGRDMITVTITSPTEAPPPKFGVFFRVSGAGVQNVWTSNFESDGFHLHPQLWWGWCSKYSSQLARDTPIAVGFNATERAPVALACSDALNYLNFGLYADDRTCEIIPRVEFFQQPTAALTRYTATILLDRRGKPWYEVVRDCTDWIIAKNGFVLADVPEAAYDPLYSTWYAYLQDVKADELAHEAVLAAELGMKTMILDDGWQKVDSVSFYSATGDWMPVPSRFPDMKKHVADVHKAGLRYMPWLAVPHVGDESKAWARFKDKLLCTHGKKSPGLVGIFDPRFPEVRAYLIETYARVIRDWDFDGVKLDFIDSFRLPEGEPDRALADNYAGRDYKSVPEAVNRLMTDVYRSLKALKPDILIEFRQHYMGPAIRQYGNMIRCADCPADPTANRRRVCDLRLTSGQTAVHSDMLVWNRDETPEGAALPILNVLFSTIQYSMILAKVRPEHRAVIKHWLAFSQAHRETLLKGSFRPHHPENGYSSIEAESAAERIVASYAADVCVNCGAADKPVILVNATGTGALLAELPTDASITTYDVLGKTTATYRVKAGLNRLKVPASGYADVRW